MSNFNVRGQETQIRISKNNAIQRTISDIKNATFNFEVTTLREDYLGQSVTQRDEIATGITGSLLIHIKDQEVLRLIQDVLDRASRRTALDALVVNIQAVLNFANGQRPKINVIDCKFGTFPLNIGGKEQYVELTLPFEAETGKLSFT